MADYAGWVLGDTERKEGNVAAWAINSATVKSGAKTPWLVRKRVLRGGRSEGVEMIEVEAGALKVAICPTRGMGIWKASYRGWDLGWNSPVPGPVHPTFVNLQDYGGIGWIAGFDEWIVRCGLASNGAPGMDVLQDNFGNRREMMLPLHGRIANLPAHAVSVRVNREPPFDIQVSGLVDEAMLFFPRLRLASTVQIVPGSPVITLRDEVTNLRSQAEEMQLLYHCNFGPPLLEEGAQFLAPAWVVAPRDQTAAKAIDHFSTYPAPTSGVVEQVYFLQLNGAEPGKRTLAVLRNRAGNKACAIRHDLDQLPCFTLWKNPGAESDGYVTGLEPGTNFPNHKSFERKEGRVVTLPPGGKYEVTLEFEPAEGPEEVGRLVAEVDRLQTAARPTIHGKPVPHLSPG